jgi:hypothetical protein
MSSGLVCREGGAYRYVSMVADADQKPEVESVRLAVVRGERVLREEEAGSNGGVAGDAADVDYCRGPDADGARRFADEFRCLLPEGCAINGDGVPDLRAGQPVPGVEAGIVQYDNTT